jgi:putative DNA primase/helicase
MSDFISFCRGHGILISSLPPIGVWRRYPTEDHPRKRNGAVKWQGDVGFCQNHATQTEVSVWKPDKVSAAQQKNWVEEAKKAESLVRQRQREAAGKAAGILKDCQIGGHAYLEGKGFPEEVGNVWVKDGVKTLVIPMRLNSHLVGVQLISESGEKKFLYGQRTSGAEFVFDNKGPHILAEGYATALAVRLILKSMKRRYTIHVCFSAGNMARVAERLPSGFVVADNDASGTGERIAREIGWPYWMSDIVGEDCNDTLKRLGLFRAGASLLKVLKV